MSDRGSSSYTNFSDHTDGDMKRQGRTSTGLDVFTADDGLPCRTPEQVFVFPLSPPTSLIAEQWIRCG